MTNRQLADAIGVTEESARLYRVGLRRPSLLTAGCIITLTGGAVGYADLREAYDRRRAGVPVPVPTGRVVKWWTDAQDP